MPTLTLFPAGLDPIDGVYELRVSGDGVRTLQFTARDETIAAVLDDLGPHQGLLRTECALVPYFWCRTAHELHLWMDGDTYIFEIHEADNESGVRRSPGGASGDVTAPMPGVIRKVLVAAGDTVEAGVSLIVMESMKMQLSLPAAANATVAEVLCDEGEMVDMGAILIRLDPVDQKLEVEASPDAGAEPTP